MPIIDIHTHAWTDALAAKAMPALQSAGQGFIARYDGTLGGLLREMDRAGVDISVIQPVATKPGQVETINDWAAAAGSERIVVFGAMHPDFPDPAAEIARMRTLGLRGFKLHPEHQSFVPDEPRMAAIYDAAVEYGMTVFFHAGADVIHAGVRGTPAAFARVMDSWPRMSAVLAHLGGFRQWEGVAAYVVGRDVWLDCAYTLGHLPDDEFVALVRAHGTDRVLFGSDGPWTDTREEIAHLRRLSFSDSELDGILGGNAERLLGL